MNLSAPKIMCFGEVLWDMLPSGEKPGGAPMNVALHLKNFGFDVTMVSRLGNDEPGKGLKNFLEDSALHTKYIQQDDSLKTSKVLVHIKGQEASYEICEPVAWDHIEYTEELKNRVKNCSYIIYGTLAARRKKTRDTLNAILASDDMVKIMDVNLRPPYNSQAIVVPLLEKADVLKLNDEEIQLIGSWFNLGIKDIPSLMEWMTQRFSLSSVCVTLGEKGAYLFQYGKLFHHGGYKVNAKDPVGAGDAFLAGLIYSMISDKTPEECLNYSCATGALVASKDGATPQYNRNEIDVILEKQHETKVS